MVSDAIRREMARGGQIYYVSNRVRSIDEAVKRVQAAAGEARVGVAHGKMTKEQLEDVMENFAAGELDVLVATTIIESGIDNPHTNTLIIEDSQRLGLAQMYQLKGRVGVLPPRRMRISCSLTIFRSLKKRWRALRRLVSTPIWEAVCAWLCATWKSAGLAAY